MKKLIYISLFLIFACNSEDVNDCFQTAGTIIEEVKVVPNFERILVNRGIELIIKEAPNYKVTVLTGENLINDVVVAVVGNQLVLTDNNNCNYVRDYGITKVYVEAPNLTELRTSSQYEIVSDGILNYNTLTLFSEDFNGGSQFTVGDFRLSVNSKNITISSNNISFFYLDGVVDNMFIGFYSGAGRFEGENLIAQNVDVFHRSSNDMVVNPVQSLAGELRGTGNLIAVNEPPVVSVERIYIGQLIFN
ncbi:head GIN domain-containing protein [uncultured Winogradskyella sp.]|uniref:head GIN domain-containing protein n=1 Tax=uncultured Winogradskyella sp. TaxID=395353 RepID=UPI0030DB809C|tara:strand:+ start:115184 stop:115927 length:744 start_codon:yes stop_codon:yes gene_type:complete